MKILVTPTSFLKPVNEEAKKRLEAFAGEVIYNETGKPLSEDQVAEYFNNDIDGYIAGVDYITAKVISAAPASLKVISRYGAGVDRVDLKAAKEKGIAVTNTPGANSVAVCELAFGLMLSVARSIPRLDAEVREGKWPRSQGKELFGKTLGIVGLGAIGKNLALRAKAFGMEVMAYDPYMDYDFAALHNIIVKELDELLASADFISLHVPLNEGTRHMISKDSIESMKDGAVIVNTARGGLIDEEAAAAALKTGKLGGLGLDAFEEEPLINSPLKYAENVIFTPHTGAHTAEAAQGMANMAVDNLIEILSGGECPHIVNK